MYAEIFEIQKLFNCKQIKFFLIFSENVFKYNNVMCTRYSSFSVSFPFVVVSLIVGGLEDASLEFEGRVCCLICFLACMFGEIFDRCSLLEGSLVWSIHQINLKVMFQLQFKLPALTVPIFFKVCFPLYTS